MYTVKQFGKTSCSALLWPDLALRASDAPDQIIDLTKVLTNDTIEEVGRKGKGEKKLSQSTFLFYLCSFVEMWDEVI